MQIHEDKQVQHTASDRLQGSSGDYFVIDRAAFNQGENAQFDMQITRGGGTSRHSLQEDRAQWSYLWTKVGALCATDYKWVQQEQVEQGKIIPVIH